MRQRTVLAAALAAALLVLPAQASAGAPNYDCVVGDSGRLAIDQYSELVAASGFAPGPTVWGVADDIHQRGQATAAAEAIRRALTCGFRTSGSSGCRPGGA